MPTPDDRPRHGAAPTLIRCPKHPAELARPITNHLIAFTAIFAVIGAALSVGSIVRGSTPVLGLPVLLPGFFVLGVFVVWEIHA